MRLRAGWLLCAGLVALLAAAAWLLWQQGQPQRDLAAARARWAATAVPRYRLTVEMRGWGACTQEAVVLGRQVVQIARNSCRFFNPRSVELLFSEVERFLRPPELGGSCRRGLPGRDCACYAPYQVETIYNVTYGYPEALQVKSERYLPNRAHLDYWRYLLRNGREPACGGPVEPAGRHVVVLGFDPLP